MTRSPLKRSTKPLKRSRIRPLSMSQVAIRKRTCNTLWGQCVHALCPLGCVICHYKGDENQACHLTGKGSNPFIRHELMNGAIMCHTHHADYDGRSGQAAQKNAEAYMENHYPLHWKWKQDHEHDRCRRIPLSEVEIELRATLEAIEKQKNVKT